LTFTSSSIKIDLIKNYTQIRGKNIMASQYQQYSAVRKYWHLMRPHTLTAAVVPVLVGTATSKLFLLGSEDHLNLPLFLAMLIACLLIQAATNMFNEYYDFKKGLDDHTSVGIGGAIVRNGMSPKLVMNLAIAFYIIAAILGIFIASQSSFWLLPIGLVCMAVGYLYTGGPFPISWTPFGELFSGVFMGMFIIMIAFFIQTNNLQSLAFWVSLPIVITIALINMGNNIRDRVKDKESGRKTLPILIGKNNSVRFLGFMYICPNSYQPQR
jgi:1,4-dihydroxy-2-naphthoate octaprenyltransferase